MTVIKCDVSRNGYQKFGAEFILVISRVESRGRFSRYFSHGANCWNAFPRVWMFLSGIVEKQEDFFDEFPSTSDDQEDDRS